eukprot:88479-Lingulodinium_polyedra.AAC.1
MLGGAGSTTRREAESPAVLLGLRLRHPEEIFRRDTFLRQRCRRHPSAAEDPESTWIYSMGCTGGNTPPAATGGATWHRCHRIARRAGGRLAGVIHEQHPGGL